MSTKRAASELRLWKTMVGLCRFYLILLWSTVGRKNGIIEILVNTNQLFVAKIAHYIRQFLPPQKMVLLTADIDFCSFNEANN